MAKDDDPMKALRDAMKITDNLQGSTKVVRDSMRFTDALKGPTGLMGPGLDEAFKAQRGLGSVPTMLSMSEAFRAADALRLAPSLRTDEPLVGALAALKTPVRTGLGGTEMPRYTGLGGTEMPAYRSLAEAAAMQQKLAEEAARELETKQAALDEERAELQKRADVDIEKDDEPKAEPVNAGPFVEKLVEVANASAAVVVQQAAAEKFAADLAHAEELERLRTKHAKEIEDHKSQLARTAQEASDSARRAHELKLEGYRRWTTIIVACIALIGPIVAGTVAYYVGLRTVEATLQKAK